MIKTTSQLLQEYSNYINPHAKIKRLVNEGKYFPIVNGLYETDKNTPGHFLSAYIYGPSYLSFDYALAYYNLIPESVYTYTAATYNKNKTKRFNTQFGNYIYRDVPKEVYSFGINIHEESGYTYLIASPEKALCDKLYGIKQIRGYKEFKNTLFNDLRIDYNSLVSLDDKEIVFLARKYRSTNLNHLIKYIEEETNYEEVK